ncbi:unnamed protein product [Dicrocoelium dendriticum]|nr:unnamed protein product [Dicrocoelium dendriticum]
MEEAGAVSNYRKIFQQIRTTGPRKPGVKETNRISAGALIHNKEYRMARWQEYFQDQFGSSASGSLLIQVLQDEVWSVSLDALTEDEV